MGSKEQNKQGNETTSYRHREKLMVARWIEKVKGLRSNYKTAMGM